MLKQLLLGTLLLLTAAGLRSQVDSLGQWRSLQSFASGAYVTQSPEAVIYTTGNVVFFLDKEDLSIRPLTRTDGLAGGKIDRVKYHAPTGTLIIVYENSTIDLYRRGRFSTLRQIDNFNFSGDKRIYDISFGEDNTVYLATGYGLSSLSLDEQIFNFTTFTGVRVNSVAAHAGHLYAATPEGLYRAPLRGVNLNDFNRWTLLGPAAGLPGDYSSNTLATWRDALYFSVDEDVYRLQGDTARIHYDAVRADNRLEYLSGGPSVLLAGYRCTTGNCADRVILAMGETPGVGTELPDCAYRTNYGIEDESGRIWFGDAAEDIRYLTAAAGECRRLAYPGPPKDRVYRLLHDGTALWVAPGQLDENTTPTFDADGVWRYADGSWTTFTPFNTPALRGRNGSTGGDDDFLTIIDVDYDPVNRVHYFSSFFEGVVGRDAEGEFTLYDETNSSLELAPDAGPGRIRAAGAATDVQGYTYFAVSRAESGGIVSVRSPDGQWAALGQSCDLNIAIDIAVDDFGYVWVVHRGGSNGGLTVIDPMGTPMDPSDDRCRTILASSQNQLPTNQTRSIAVDLEGNVWVGTAEGIVIFTCPGTVFDTESCTGYRPLVSADDGFGGYLLETEEIRTIAVDGGNRKWIGTNGGAFLLSEAGDEQLLKFDRGNSPLLDDVVKSIAIDPVSGTVYFGTELGIISYRGDATAAAEVFTGELEVFPNPVEPGYDGPIAVRGLARDARVKITDVGGKLVYEGLATGGQFSWAGTDYNGRRVATGVYLVFASSNRRFALENPGSAVAKIVFIR
ncbi:hypothetical protein GGR26_002548 [Lewinella marina]|uniref:PorZ N-terminal beta-propeller domain-containing protein n=1 Tax=Neolewinella marina TaxID=438751 RepID=A0A2G0CC78_9BACT|nr:hypothetical protein [Neolewinella marina]NJB86771.1 hypothetical protein [Neolewinella marina]PHK97576.1 hypothetical protein CGL56_15885 [Neolewinella marina]